MTSPLILLSLAGLFGGLAQVIGKQLTRSKHHSSSYSTATLIGCTLFSTPLLFFEFRLPTHLSTWIVIAISVFSYGISNALGYAAYKHTDISIVSIIQRLGIVVIFFFGILFFQESLTIKKLIGLLCIMLGSLIVMYQKNRHKSEMRGIFYAIVMTITGSIAALIDKQVLTDISPITYVFVNNALLSVLFMPFKGNLKESLAIFRAKPLLIGIRSLLANAGFVLVLLALKDGAISTIMPIYKSISLIVPVTLGILFLKETTSLPQKITGLSLSTLGIFLMY